MPSTHDDEHCLINSREAFSQHPSRGISGPTMRSQLAKGVHSLSVLLFLRILSLLVAAAGGAIALFGEPRSNGRLTPAGMLALGFVLGGFVASVVMEILTARRDSVSEAWAVTRDQALTQLMFAWYHERPMSVREFAEILRQVRVTIGTLAEREGEGDHPVVRYLEFHVDDGKVDDLEQAIRLQTRSRARQVFATGFPSSLYYRDQPGWWTASVDKCWDSWNLETVGIETTIPYHKLALPTTLRRVGDLARITSVTVLLPAELNRNDVNRMNLSFLTSDYQLFTIDLKRLDYGLISGSTVIEATIAGVDLLSAAKRQFERRGGRQGAAAVFE